MNKIYRIFILLMIIGSVSDAMGLPTRNYCRTKQGCGLLGCANTVKTKTLVYVTEPGGHVKRYYDIAINCDGVGFSGCPRTVLQEDEPDVFQAANTNDQVEFADTEITNGILNGTRTITVLNTTTNVTWRYVVTWSTVDGVETIENTMEAI